MLPSHFGQNFGRYDGRNNGRKAFGRTLLPGGPNASDRITFTPHFLRFLDLSCCLLGARTGIIFAQITVKQTGKVKTGGRKTGLTDPVPLAFPLEWPWPLEDISLFLIYLPITASLKIYSPIDECIFCSNVTVEFEKACL